MPQTHATNMNKSDEYFHKCLTFHMIWLTQSFQHLVWRPPLELCHDIIFYKYLFKAVIFRKSQSTFSIISEVTDKSLKWGYKIKLQPQVWINDIFVSDGEQHIILHLSQWYLTGEQTYKQWLLAEESLHRFKHLDRL